MYNIVFPLPEDLIVDDITALKRKGFKPPFIAWITIDGKIIPQSIMKAGSSNIVSLQHIVSINNKQKNSLVEFK